MARLKIKCCDCGAFVDFDMQAADIVNMPTVSMVVIPHPQVVHCPNCLVPLTVKATHPVNVNVESVKAAPGATAPLIATAASLPKLGG
jgi:hypothetical protein